MDIVSALFVESFNMRQAPGPSTRIDITGAFFSMAAPAPVAGHDRAAPARAHPLPARRARQRHPRGRVPARRRAGRPQRAAVRRRARQVHLPTGAGRARVRRVRHGRGALPASARARSRSCPITLLPPVVTGSVRMPFAAALSEHPLATHAIGEVVGEVLDSRSARRSPTSPPSSSPRRTSACSRTWRRRCGRCCTRAR